MGSSINSLMETLELTDALNISKSYGKKVSTAQQSCDNLGKKKKDQETVLLA